MASEAQQLNEALQYSDSDDLVSDDEVPASSSAATVTSLSGAKEYTTNINGEGAVPCMMCTVSTVRFLRVLTDCLVHTVWGTSST